MVILRMTQARIMITFKIGPITAKEILQIYILYKNLSFHQTQSGCLKSVLNAVVHGYIHAGRI